MASVVRPMMLLLFFKIARSYELYSVAEYHVPLIIDVAEFYKTRSVFFLYAQSIQTIEMTTMVFKLTRALSQKGFKTLNVYFSELHETTLYIKNIVRPMFVVLISDYEAIDEFSLATRTYNVSFPCWLVLFVYVGRGSDYCNSPPANIFHLRFDTRMLVRCVKGKILHEWYAFNEKRTEIDDIATWTLEKGITMLAPPILYDRRFNLQGLIMKAVIVKGGPFIHVNEDGQLDGIFGKILGELCLTLNFTFEIVSEVDEYGILNPEDGTWTGGVGEVYAKRADMSISDFSMSSTRIEVVDFTLPLLLSKSSIYIKEPETIAFMWSSYFRAFSKSLWLTILGTIAVTTILVMFFKLSKRRDRDVKELLQDSWLEVWGIYCAQGIADFSNRSSLRIIYVSLFLSSMVLIAAYSAAFISFLTTDIPVLPFHSLEEFIEDGTFQLAVYRGTADYDILRKSTNPFSTKLTALMLDEKDLPTNLIEGFQMVCRNRQLAIYTSDEIKKGISYGIPCKVTTINVGGVDNLAMILSKNNPFTGLINYRLQKFVNNGMMNRLKNDFKTNYKNRVTSYSISIFSVITLFSFVEIGIILSIFILIIEKCVFAYKRSKTPIKTLKRSYVKRKKYKRDKKARIADLSDLRG